MAGFWELILVFNKITSLWWAENFRFEEKRMWSWWGLDYFCHKKQLSATFWSGGLTFVGGSHILRIKSSLCNNLCKHYLVEFLFYVCTFVSYFYLIGIWNKCLKPLVFFQKHLNKNKCTYVLYKLIPIKLCCVQGL
jgi:hypothetical protein